MRLYSYLKRNLNITKGELEILYNESKITVNDMNVNMSYKLKLNDIVKVNGKVIDNAINEYFLYYKPIGVLSTIRDSSNSYINVLGLDNKLTPAGRLDKLSEGLMILSNDGKFIDSIARKNNIDKEYIVTLKFPITDEFINNLRKSYNLNGKITTPFKVKVNDSYSINVILYEGIYHEIRRVVGLSGNKVIALKRIRIGNYTIDGMKPGDIKKINGPR